MTSKVNGNIHIELWDLDDDHNEVALRDDVIPDLRRYQVNTPCRCEVSISETFNSSQDTADITIYNAPIIDQLAADPAPIYEDLRATRKKIKIWQYWPDNDAFYAPVDRELVYVGDLDPDIKANPKGSDIELKIRANSHRRLIRKGRDEMKPLKWREGVHTYQDVVTEVLESLNLTFKMQGYQISDPDGKLIKPVKRIYQPQKNATEILNDICRTFDCVWGVTKDTLYFSDRRHLLEDNMTFYDTPQMVSVDTTGKIGLTSFGALEFTARNLSDAEAGIGRRLYYADTPKIETVAAFYGRIN